MISRSSRCMVSNPITCCSVMRWASTPRGMECPQHKKTEGAFRPLERGFEGLPGFFMSGGQTDIKDVNALIRQVDQGLLEQREQDRIAPLRSHTAQGLHRVLASKAREELLAVRIERGHIPLIDRPAVE